MAMHDGLPVAGYQPQPEERVAAVNDHKLNEERLLRTIERQRDAGLLDPRCAALAITGFQQAFMWLNRGIFQPARISNLPEEERDA